jgi:uncharacterized pyridoxamine 5'-phosphate oxidase family protein
MKEFYEVLNNAREIALATVVEDTPNVRIVNFVYDIEKPGILFFTSNRNNQKVIEFKENHKIAFTTVPIEGIPHVRSHKAIVKKSEYSLNDLKPIFISRIPGYDETIEVLGDVLELFEIHVNEAKIVTGFGKPLVVSFGSPDMP